MLRLEETIRKITTREPMLSFEDAGDSKLFIEDFIKDKNNKILRYADFTGLNLSGINLEGLDLSGASFYRTNLEGANLESTILTETNFCHATMRSANLCKAHIEGTIFNEANVSDVKVFDERNREIIRLKNKPIIISGLSLPVTILDDMIAVGCAFLRADEWAEICKDGENAVRKKLSNRFKGTDGFIKDLSQIIFDIHSVGSGPSNSTTTITIINDYDGLKEEMVVVDIRCPPGVSSNMKIGDSIDFGETKKFSSSNSDRWFFSLKSIITGIVTKYAGTSPKSIKNSASGYGSGGLEHYDRGGDASFTFHPGSKDQADWSHGDEYDGDHPVYGDCS